MPANQPQSFNAGRKLNTIHEFRLQPREFDAGWGSLAPGFRGGFGPRAGGVRRPPGAADYGMLGQRERDDLWSEFVEVREREREREREGGREGER